MRIAACPQPQPRCSPLSVQAAPAMSRTASCLKPRKSPSQEQRIRNSLYKRLPHRVNSRICVADRGAPTLNQRAEGVADSGHRYAEGDTCAFLGGGDGHGHKVRARGPKDWMNWTTVIKGPMGGSSCILARACSRDPQQSPCSTSQRRERGRGSRLASGDVTSQGSECHEGVEAGIAKCKPANHNLGAAHCA